MRRTWKIGLQSTVRKKMAAGTFTYNALRTKTLKGKLYVIQTRQEQCC